MNRTPTTPKRRLFLRGFVPDAGGAASARAWLPTLAAGCLLVSAGCAGSDPTGPTDPAFSDLEILTASLPQGVVDVAYGAHALEAAGGDGSYSWTLASGRQPAGLTLAPDGVITGTPTAIETRSFTLRVTSGDGQTAERALSIAVGAPPTLQPDQLCSDDLAYARATFEDAHLEAAVRSALAVDAQAALTCGMLATLERLEAPSLGITSLAGMQNLTGLVDVELGNNGITDLGPLSGLTSLTDLSLFRNAITDIDALSGLTDLWFLNLNFNAITDVAPLGGLTEVRILFLGNNAIGDISALGGLARLENLSLEGNPLTDIETLRGLTGLEDLRLGATSISDYGPLAGLTRLEYLGLSDNAITDVTALGALLGGLERLWYLSLSDNAIADLGPLGGLTGLTYLGLSNNAVTDIGPLGGLADLATLYLTENAITDVTALSGLTSLRYLGLSDNPDLDDIRPLLDNSGLGAGVSVTLFRTSVGCADVAALRAKGVATYSSGCP